MRTRLSKCQRSGSSNSAGCPRHQCSFVLLNHSYSPPLHELLLRALSEQNHLAEIRNVTSCTSAQAFIPPSTVRFAPVMYEDSGPATNATNAATSSTRPYRSSAVAA